MVERQEPLREEMEETVFKVPMVQAAAAAVAQEQLQREMPEGVCQLLQQEEQQLQEVVPVVPEVLSHKLE